MIAYVLVTAAFRRLFPSGEGNATRSAARNEGRAVSQVTPPSATARSVRDAGSGGLRVRTAGTVVPAAPPSRDADEVLAESKSQSRKAEIVDASRIDPSAIPGLKPHRDLGASVVQIMAMGLSVALVVAALLFGLPAQPVVVTPPPSFAAIPPQAGAGRSDGDLPLDVGYQLKFSKPMNESSVKAAVTISPNVGLNYEWDAMSETVALKPSPHWNPKTTYVVVVGTAARDQQGLGLSDAISASFTSGDLTSGQLTATEVLGDLVSPGTSFQLTFTRPVKLLTVQSHLSIKMAAPCPPIDGVTSAPVDGSCPDLNGQPQYPECQESGGVTVTPVGGFCPDAIPLDVVGDDPTDVASQVFTATPHTQLLSMSTFEVTFSPGSGKTAAADSAGATLQPILPLQVTTMAAPAVLRFLPRDGSTTYDTNSPISVRFTTAMDTKTTAAAFTVTDDGVAVGGSKTWSEGNKVLTLTPRTSFGVGSKITATVTTAARSSTGLHIEVGATATFKVSVRPAARIYGGGGNTNSAPWHSSEVYYMALMNCTRTGGWVTSGGNCSSVTHHTLPAQGRLGLSSGISNAVSRPYAKYMADHRLLSHFLHFGGGSNPHARLCAKGYCDSSWGENIASPSSTTTGGMVSIEIFYQNEYWCRCEHYANIMNGHFSVAGVGVWFSNSVRVAIDFYA
jgi:hypothetical protein